MSGDTTIVSPSRIKAGNWKQSDFPPPVGINTNTSRPASASRMISSCNGRNWSCPKCFLTVALRSTARTYSVLWLRCIAESGVLRRLLTAWRLAVRLPFLVEIEPLQAVFPLFGRELLCGKVALFPLYRFFKATELGTDCCLRVP